MQSVDGVGMLLAEGTRQFTTHDNETELQTVAVRPGNGSKLDVIKKNRKIISLVSRQRNHLLG
jgi:hypothetical protein